MLRKEDRIILYIDDEQANLDVFKISFSNLYNIYTTTSVKEAWEILNSTNVKILISDQRMPEILGLDLINQVHNTYPDIVTILLTAFSDTNILLEAINKVGLYKYLLKPWRGDEMIMSLNNAFEKYVLVQERKKLLLDLKDQNTQLRIEKTKAEESARLKAAFLANISHEIRTPMNGIIGFSELLLQENIDKSMREKYSQLVNISTKNLLTILNDIITLSELQAETYTVNQSSTSINEIASNLHNLKNDLINKFSKENLFISIQTTSDYRNFVCPQNCIHTIIEKLFENAVKYTETGTVKLNFEINNENQNHQLLIQVEDSGIGIPKDKLGQIFEAFYQPKPDPGKINSGNGIGLTIVKSLIELVDGSINIISEPGKGSLFIVSIPIQI